MQRSIRASGAAASPYTQLQQMLTCLDQLIAGEKIEARY